MAENSMKPRIRFKGYTDAWEQRELGEIMICYSGGTPTVGKSEYYSGTIPFIRSGEISKDKTEIFLSELGFKNSSAAMVNEGDILYALYGATSGEVSRSALKGAINQAILAIIPSKGDDSAFIVQWLRREKNHIIDTYLQGGQGNLSASLVKALIISLPKQREQVQIGRLFEQLDNLITLHQRKYDKIVNIKKALLEKMFPADAETTPKIRFRGFTDAWEQRKLGDVAKINMGQSPDGANYTTNPNDAILVQGNADMSDGWVLPRVYTKQITKQAHIGDLIFSVRAPVGEVGKTQYNVVIGRGVAAISGNEFIFQSLKRMNSLGYWTKLAAGSTFESINSDTLKTAEFAIPKENEQTRIGEILLKIDNLITLHQRQLEKLKNIKSALLEKMFV